MRRLPLLDAVMIAVLVPGWMLVLGLHVRQLARGNLVLPGVYVEGATTADDHPRVRAFWPGQDGGSLAIGDTLRSVGGADLIGASAFRFFALAHEERAKTASGVAPLVVYDRAGERSQTSLPFVSPHAAWRVLPLTVGFAVTGTLVLLSRPGVPVARAFFLAAMAFGIHWAWFFGGSLVITYAWFVVYSIVTTVMFPLVLLTASMFPEGSPRLRWVWVFVVGGPIVLTAAVGAPLSPEFGLPAMYVLNIAITIALIGVVARNHAHATPVGRRQLRWGLYGICAGTIPVVSANVLTLAVPSLWWLHDVAAVMEVLIPLGLFVALSRFNLYDIDRLLTSTLLYTVVLTLTLWGMLVASPLAARSLSSALGIDPTLGTVALSGVIALMLVMLSHSLNPALERRLFKKRYALQDGVNRLLTDIRGITDPRTLLGLVGHRLSDLFGSVSCAVYEPSDGQWVPLLSIGSFRGRETAPDLASHGVLVPSLERADTPLDMEIWRRMHPVTEIPMDDRLVLEHLAPFVVLPVRASGSLVATVTLGAKSSGDIYSSGDFALLAAVAETVGNELARIEEMRRTATAPVLVPSRYTVLGEIGRGGMGIVYRVRHVTLRADFALKILRHELAPHADLVQRFLREARIMSQLRHPNIVRVFDVDTENGVFSFVMEHVKGRSLSAIIQTEGPLPLERAAGLARQVGDALTHAHTRHPPVIHRDIKPGNILVEDETGRAIVTDFGIAKIIDAEDSSATQTGSRLGTPQYCAPEQLRGERDLDERSDVYALGMVLYEMVMGRPLLGDLGAEEICRLVAWESEDHQITLNAILPGELEAIIGKAVRKDRDRRYPSIAAVVEDLWALVPSLSKGSDLALKDASPASSRPSNITAVPRQGVTEVPETRQTYPQADSLKAELAWVDGVTALTRTKT